MEDHRQSGMNQTSRPQYHNPPPVTVPRSQYASTVRSSTHRPIAGNAGPRYFSSPFRAPLNHQERHDSFIEHQKSISNTRDSDTLPKPYYSQPSERSSYAFFDPHATVGPLKVPKKSSQVPSDYDRSDGGSQSSQDQAGVVRQASIGHKAKPSLTNVKRSDSTQTNKPHAGPKTPPPKATTINALSVPIAAAIKNPAKQPSRPPTSCNVSSSRMPFDSPSSTYSQDLQHTRQPHLRSSNAVADTGRVSPLEEEVRTPSQLEPDRLSPVPGPTPHSEKSSSSANPLLGLGIERQGISSRVPEEMRPPTLNINAVRDMESRGSITSLPDLIRRATRLAANLDRGKTASKFGLWDMFSNVDQTHAKKRESTFSDVLNAFPDPASGTPTKAPRPTTLWPAKAKDNVMVSEKQMVEPKKQARKCCGLSMTTFIIVLVIVILLIAAAVLIPIFLVVIPRQNHTSAVNLNNCRASHLCQNDGTNIVDNNACSCVCRDGFTGSDCSHPTDPSCVTSDIIDGSHTYDNATVGSSIVSLLLEAQGKMNIPVNSSILLSVFANNNLSCASENSLVNFDLSSRPKEKRFIIVHGWKPQDEAIANIPVPAETSKHAPSRTAAALAIRQTAVETSNDIVYQATSTQGAAIATSSQAATATTSATQTSSSTAPTTVANITSDQLEFAQLVVLYVLVGSRIPSTAVVAQQNIEQYFRAGALESGNSTVDVVHMGDVEITANFEKLAIVLSDGKVIGGSSVSG